MINKIIISLISMAGIAISPRLIMPLYGIGGPTGHVVETHTDGHTAREVYEDVQNKVSELGYKDFNLAVEKYMFQLWLQQAFDQNHFPEIKELTMVKGHQPKIFPYISFDGRADVMAWLAKNPYKGPTSINPDNRIVGAVQIDSAYKNWIYDTITRHDQRCLKIKRFILPWAN